MRMGIQMGISKYEWGWARQLQELLQYLLQEGNRTMKKRGLKREEKRRRRGRDYQELGSGKWDPAAVSHELCHGQKKL